jgi:LPXTG-motif cell wall-anchored protein
MSLQSIRSRTALAVMGVAVLAGAFAPNHAKADEWNKKTVLTINEPIQIRDTYLQPGQYVLRLLDSQSDRHVVQIFNADQSRLINTVLAIPKERLDVTGHSEFTFWETPAGKARAMRAWFYPGDLIGNEFPYPKHLHDVAMAETTTTEAVTAAPLPPTPTVEPTPMEQPKTEQPVEPTTPPPVVEQPPAQPATPQAATTPPPENTEAPPPSELPKTGSPYPLIGLTGLLLLGISGVVRFARLA